MTTVGSLFTGYGGLDMGVVPQQAALAVSSLLQIVNGLEDVNI